jgi:hypothetical protein
VRYACRDRMSTLDDLADFKLERKLSTRPNAHFQYNGKHKRVEIMSGESIEWGGEGKRVHVNDYRCQCIRPMHSHTTQPTAWLSLCRSETYRHIRSLRPAGLCPDGLAVRLIGIIASKIRCRFQLRFPLKSA